MRQRSRLSDAGDPEPTSPTCDCLRGSQCKRWAVSTMSCNRGCFLPLVNPIECTTACPWLGLWLCGHGIGLTREHVIWREAQSRALEGMPLCLGMADRAHAWTSSCPPLPGQVPQESARDIILIQLEASDLGTCSSLTLILKAKWHIGLLTNMLPGVRTVRSERLARSVWWTAVHPLKIDRARRKASWKTVTGLDSTGV